MNHPNSARKQDLVLINKKKRTCEVYVSVDNGVKIKENENMHKYLDLARELKTYWNMIVTVIVGALGNGSPKGVKKDFGRTGDQRKNLHHPDHSTVENS